MLHFIKIYLNILLHKNTNTHNIINIICKYIIKLPQINYNLLKYEIIKELKEINIQILLQRMNNILKYYNNFIYNNFNQLLYNNFTKEEAKKLIIYYSKCDCCIRHTINKPYCNNYNYIFINSEYIVCTCNCRSLSRRLYKIFNVSNNTIIINYTNN